MNWIYKNQIELIGAAVGATAGFLYWQNISCASGTCANTSKPINSTLNGTVLGAILADLIWDNKKRNMQKKNQQT